ncbi:hypothetical protein B0H16DRAFT_687929 [Mycena metata]|uniref:ABM domain-containing protein n=1 Tax=Mycena metata TaxID=1033252 RepID=A0AAD7NDY5_9AGAR|nr:hypothetical protein B0H16DRAFT_687929 [Mycena metata]
MPGISSVTFPANAAKLAEGPTAVQKALDILKSTPGVIGAYHGIQVEDGKTAYFSTIWEGADAHTAFLKGEGHTAYATALKALADGPIDGHYVEVDSDPSKVFDSPVTEGIHFVTKNIDDPVWAQMAASIASVAPASTWGRSGDNHIMYFVGWESVEVSRLMFPALSCRAKESI